jgi:carbon starvation protein
VLHAINTTMSAWQLWVWVILLLIYAYIASVLPVWSLLQPRDYINSLQLISALALILLGLLGATFFGGAALPDGTQPTLKIVAPMVQWNPQGAPFIFPFLFITIACGAISGFHCLVSSGTSSKQLQCEPDARFVGYGGMLLEGFLATLVILACAAGLGLGLTLADGSVLVGSEAWGQRYSSWGAAGSLAAKVSAFVDGSSNFLKAIGLPGSVALALMGVLVASFAGTTMDTACRLQRYVIQELAGTLASKTRRNQTGGISGVLMLLRNKHGATILAIIIAAILAAAPPVGQSWTLKSAGTGGLLLWPLFGATNQLLGGLSFIVVAFFLWRRKRPIWFLIVPMLFMLVMPMWAMLVQLFVGSGGAAPWIRSGNGMLITIALSTILLEIWMIYEAVRMFPRVKGILEENALDQLNRPSAQA